MAVLVYVNTSKQVGDVDHIKVFATTDAAETWFEENDGIRVSGNWNCYRVKESDMGFQFSAPKPNREKAASATSSQSAGAVSFPKRKARLLAGRIENIPNVMKREHLRSEKTQVSVRFVT